MEDLLYLKILNAIPFMVFVVDADVQVVDANLAALRLLGVERKTVLSIRGGHALHCIHAQVDPKGCGYAPACRDCVIRDSVRRCLNGQDVTRSRMRAELALDGAPKPFELLITVSLLDREKQWVMVMLEDISELLKLRQIVPICMYCHKVRDDQAYWQSVEEYFHSHSSVDFSHGFCPECARSHYSWLRTEEDGAPPEA
jgi:hypothetical protein